MRRTRVLLAGIVTAAVAMASGAATAATPQVVDPAGDANFVNGQGYTTVSGQSMSPVNQAYADVTSVLWETTYVTRKAGRRTVRVPDGFRVTTVLSAPPTPPEGTMLVYRMLGSPPCNTGSGGFFGVVYYSEESNDPTIPRSAVRDSCTGSTRLTRIALPAIQGSKMVWTVKLNQLPREMRAGQELTKLRFEVREIQQYPQCLPDSHPAVATCGMAQGLVDEGSGTSTYRIGR